VAAAEALTTKQQMEAVAEATRHSTARTVAAAAAAAAAPLPGDTQAQAAFTALAAAEWGIPAKAAALGLRASSSSAMRMALRGHQAASPLLLLSALR
jgi:UDP-N-acetylmuramyl pentapeptide synthase